MRRTAPRIAALVVGAVGSLVIGSTVPALAHGDAGGRHDQTLTPRTHFEMAPDGSSGATAGGEGIPNIDSVKKTIATYYGDPGTGIADKASSPYINQLRSITGGLRASLKATYDAAVAAGKKPAIVLDADDTTLWTYDMEVADMKFVFNPTRQDYWVQHELFPATPSMVDFVNEADAMGYEIFGLTGRGAAQKDATVGNLKNVGYNAFDMDHYFTKWAGSDQPSYITCATAKCTTVEYKAGTRKHIEQDLGYDIVLNVGDQYSDLQGGYADANVKLPNPTYYLPSPDLPGLEEPELSPRTSFTMAADGSSGLTQGGEGIPNIDSVKKTIATYYGDPGTGIADKVSSPYISELTALQAREHTRLTTECRETAAKGTKPAVVFDADDTTLWTYDMEVADMHFVFDPARQDVWVQNQQFPATPGMPALVDAVADAGCTVIGITGRGAAQRAATLGNLAKVGYHAFSSGLYFTKWAAGAQPSYLTCATAKCTTIEYKSQTRRYIESDAFGGYDIVANLGDQFSDLKGGSADRAIKLPNPTYYLP
ncbi:MAG TPA: HAD family acid phosphatase [Humibacillus sp.]|nr:HAD family acid phosphatase [Humibacillus sp.]